MYRRVLLWALVIGLSAAAARAVPVTVENHSFELPGTDKQANWENVPNWNSDTVAADSGVETGWGPSDGDWTGFLMGSDPSAWNLTDYTIAPGDVFTLQVDAKINGGASDFFLALYYDDAGTRVEVASDTVALTTTMVTYSLQFAADDVPASVGKQIGIELDNPAGGWVGIDNVRLDVEPGGPPVQAYNPDPAHEEPEACIRTILSWEPGIYAVKHDVYFGTGETQVTDADRDNQFGVLVSQDQDASHYPIAGALALDFDTTYYWRIDEVNAAPGYDIHKGNVWQFTTEPLAYPIDNITATASSSEAGKGPENTLNLDGDLHSTDTSAMWLSTSEVPGGAWIQYEFDKIYKLREMWVWNYNGEGLNIAFGLKEVTIEYSTDGDTWTELSGVGEFAKAPGSNGYAHETPVAFGGAAAKYVKITANSNHSSGMADQYGLSEVRFFYLPVRAKQPDPEDEAVDVEIDVTLSWSAGREAQTHELYFSDDEQAVAEDSVSPVILPAGGCGSSYGPLSLDLDKTYYWKVVEVNNAEEPNVWQSDVWSFSTPEYVVVEDFEGYDDTLENAVFATWSDGYEVGDNGSQIGYLDTPYLEQTIVYGGSWSAPLHYDNTAVVNSQATRTFDSPQNWSTGGIRALTLFFYGQADNTTPSAGEQMYVKLNGVKVVYDGDMADITQEQWHEWAIDLAAFGVNLANVTTISIGFDRGASPASGLVCFDDIRLYPSRCVPSRRTVDFAKVDFAPEGAPDCVVNYRELEIMARDWLLGDADIEAQEPDPDGLVAWYRFENNANDSSGKGNDGTENGGPPYVAGKVDAWAIDLDGFDDYVDCGNGASLNLTDQVTIAVWVKTDDAGNGEDNPYVAKGDVSYAFKHKNPTSLEFFIYDGGWHVVTFAVDSSFNDAWHHLAGTYDGAQLKMYVDGELKATTDYVGVIATSTDNLNIGRNSGVTDRFFDGMLDDVRIYDYALTQSEVLHTGGLAALYVPLVSPANVYDLEPATHQVVNFKDYAELMNVWLDEDIFP